MTADGNTTVLEFAFPSGSTRLALPRGRGTTLGALVAGIEGVDRCVVLSDEHVAPLHADRLINALARAGLDPRLFLIPAGDAHKSLDTARRVFDWMALVGADRYTAVVAVGGGMVLDLAGFVAGTWMRGVPWVAAPTTVLAMVDACLGGKVAVNHPQGKNLIGLFHHPRLIWADVPVLQTLSDRAFAAGLAESVKHAVALDATFLDWQEAHTAAINSRRPETLSRLVEHNLRLKAAVVAGDERETGAAAGIGRAALNLGHTFGHALESASDFVWPHGECVALGMVVATELAVAAGRLTAADRDRVAALLSGFALSLRAPAPFDPPDVLARLTGDKKSRRARPRLVIPEKLGAVAWFEPANDDMLRAALDRIQHQRG